MQLRFCSTFFQLADHGSIQTRHKNSRLLQQIRLAKQVWGNSQNLKLFMVDTLGSGHKKYFQRLFQEFASLSRIVSEINPESNKGWSQVCLRMHALGSRRSATDYRTKFNKYTAKQQRVSIKQNKQITGQILGLYQEGNSASHISKTLGIITPKNVQIILKGILGGITKVMQKVIGKSKIYHLKLKDYQLFGFIRQNHVKIKSLAEIDDLCKYWKGLKLKKTVLKQTNPEKYEKIKKNIELRIIEFNETLQMASSRLRQNKPENQSIKEKNTSRPKLGKRCSINTLSISNYLGSANEAEKLEKEPSTLFFKEISGGQGEQLQHQVQFCYKALSRTQLIEEQFEEDMYSLAGYQENSHHTNQEEFFKSTRKQESTYMALEFDPTQEDSALYIESLSFDMNSVLQ